MALDYRTYAEAAERFNFGERWKVFDGNPESFNIAHECIDRHPKDEIALRLQFDNGRRETHTFGELSRLTSQFANLLARRGVKAGDRVALVMNPCLEFYVTFFGTLKAGAVIVPCSALFGPEAIEFRIVKSGARAVVATREHAKLIDPKIVEHLLIAEELIGLVGGEEGVYVPHTTAEDLAVIQFSSGTTGAPKAVEYRHVAATYTAVNVKFGIGLRQDDVYFCPSSPAWGHGIWYGTVGPLIFGKAIGAYSGKFEAETLLGALEHFGVTNMSAAPLVYRRIMESGKIDAYKLRLRRITYTGGAMDNETRQFLQERLGLYPNSFYGSTEVGVVILDYAFEDYQPRPGSLGKPMLGLRVAVIDEDGRELPPGQVGQMALWRNNGWVRIGDAVYMDEDGYFWYKGRSDDVIISAGYTIGPLEIEAVLEKHPGVKRAAVVGSPDRERGEIVKAFIIPESEPTEELKRDIQEYVKTRLSKHEYPREIEFVNELPETPDGKIKRKVLRELEYERKRQAGLVD